MTQKQQANRREKIRRMVSKGMTLEAIAAKLGVSYSLVYKVSVEKKGTI